MNSAIAVFFASLVSGVMSLADLRPAAADVFQILTGVELAPQESSTPEKKQQVYRVPATQPESKSCQTALSAWLDHHKPSRCQV